MISGPQLDPKRTQKDPNGPTNIILTYFWYDWRQQHSCLQTLTPTGPSTNPKQARNIIFLTCFRYNWRCQRSCLQTLPQRTPNEPPTDPEILFQLTFGTIGGDSVLASKPSQSKPWYHLCFLMSWMPSFWQPSLSVGFSRQNLRIIVMAVLVTCLGNSICSIPRKIMLYIFMGSLAVKGGLKIIEHFVL